jgi:hypothetical protein
MKCPPEGVVEVEEVVLVVEEEAEEEVPAEAWVLVRLLHLVRQLKLPNSYGSKKSVLLINTDNSILIFGISKSDCNL